VYLCGERFIEEDHLIDHFNSKHADLYELGIKLRKSKTSRRSLKHKNAKKVVIGDKKKDSDTDSDSDLDDEIEMADGAKEEKR
jgi:hypothetical protein